MQDEETIDLIITSEDHKNFKRLDQYLTEKLERFSRNFIKNLFLKELIFLSEDSPYRGKIELKKLPPTGTIITVDVPPPAPASAQAENIALEILYEDSHLLIINKEPGMVVHPAPGHDSGTLVNAVLYHCQDLTGVGDEKRPGIVHRLDKGTSGIMVVAKNQKCHEGLVLLFSQHDIERVYEAIVLKTGLLQKGTLEASIGRHPQNRLKMAAEVRGGKWAKTYYQLISEYYPASHVQCTLETGRTHQIRVHLSQLLNAPLLMDPLYGNPKDHLNRLGNHTKKLLKDYPHPLLHARVLGFQHPITQKILRFECPAPEIFQETLQTLKKDLET